MDESTKLGESGSLYLLGRDNGDGLKLRSNAPNGFLVGGDDWHDPTPRCLDINDPNRRTMDPLGDCGELLDRMTREYYQECAGGREILNSYSPYFDRRAEQEYPTPPENFQDSASYDQNDTKLDLRRAWNIHSAEGLLSDSGMPFLAQKMVEGKLGILEREVDDFRQLAGLLLGGPAFRVCGKK